MLWVRVLGRTYSQIVKFIPRNINKRGMPNINSSITQPGIILLNTVLRSTQFLVTTPQWRQMENFDSKNDQQRLIRNRSLEAVHFVLVITVCPQFKIYWNQFVRLYPVSGYRPKGVIRRVIGGLPPLCPSVMITHSPSQPPALSSPNTK